MMSDVAAGIARANTHVLANLMRQLAATGILPETAIADMLQHVASEFLTAAEQPKGTILDAVSAHHVEELRTMFLRASP